MDLCSEILGVNSRRFVNSQLVCLLPAGILNWERGDFNMTLKSPFRGVITKYLLLLLLLLLLLITQQF